MYTSGTASQPDGSLLPWVRNTSINAKCMFCVVCSWSVGSLKSKDFSSSWMELSGTVLLCRLMTVARSISQNFSGSVIAGSPLMTRVFFWGLWWEQHPCKLWVSQARNITLSGNDIRAEWQGVNPMHYLVCDIVVGRAALWRRYFLKENKGRQNSWLVTIIRH